MKTESKHWRRRETFDREERAVAARPAQLCASLASPSRTRPGLFLARCYRLAPFFATQSPLSSRPPISPRVPSRDLAGRRRPNPSLPSLPLRIQIVAAQNKNWRGCWRQKPPFLEKGKKTPVKYGFRDWEEKSVNEAASSRRHCSFLWAFLSAFSISPSEKFSFSRTELVTILFPLILHKFLANED